MYIGTFENQHSDSVRILMNLKQEGVTEWPASFQ